MNENVMAGSVLDLRKSINQAYRKQKPLRSDIERFKTNLKQLLENIDEEESEEHCKNHLTRFLRETYYADRHEINTYGKTDLVIHNGKSAKSPVGVLLEAKRPKNKADMVSPGNLDAKAMQELLLYYLRERHDHKNTELKYCIITNAYDWFIFDAAEFYQYFYQNKSLRKEYEAWRNGQKESSSTDYFYKTIASPAIQKVATELSYTHVSLTDFKELLQKELPEHERKLVLLYKLFSPGHLLKQPFTNDSNTLDKKFYDELLHIIGLTETKEKGKKLIEHKGKEERNAGSLLENATTPLEAEIDQMVYLLYGLTEEKIAIVEGKEKVVNE